MISNNAICKILGIEESVDLKLADMISKVKIALSPNKDNASDLVLQFTEELKKTFSEMGVEIIPYEDIWEIVPNKKRLKRLFKYSINNIIYLIRYILKRSQISFFISFRSMKVLCSRKKIKSGITVICSGEQSVEKLQMQHISSFKTNSIVTIVDIPGKITESNDFIEHFDTSMSLFAHHMTNIIIGVNSKNWLVYNFNASHPIYKYPDDNFKEHILKSLIPKLAAPISPHKLKDFLINESRFKVSDNVYSKAISEMVNSAKLFMKTNLYPEGKKIDDLPFRDNFHKLIGKIHLDNRSGMSFGFIAYQLPTKLIPATNLDTFKKINKEAFINDDYYVDGNNNLFILHKIKDFKIVLQVPDVWVLTIKSGASKTNFNPNSDLIKIGLLKGKLAMELPDGLNIDNTYKPSFDTKVILAHAVSNALIAQVAKYLERWNDYVKKIENHGFSISHWHGYVNKECLMKNIVMYGKDNPHVSCSSPQSAVYAFSGKYENILDQILDIDEFNGDIHIEPHHGINVSYHSMVDLVKYIIDNPDFTKLGNKYL